MGTGEDDETRLRRNLNELLQELRVAQAGVQILFGFLLAVTFTQPYLDGTDWQHGIHLVTVGLTVAAIALLTAPAAWHRVLFRHGQRVRIVQTANRLAIAGLMCLAAAMTGTVLLLFATVTGLGTGLAVSAAALVGFAALWFLLPMRHRSGEAREAPLRVGRSPDREPAP